MPGFAFLGEEPPMGPNDTIKMVDEIRRFDIVTFVPAGSGEFHVRVVKDSEFSTFNGAMYQIDRLPEDDEILLFRQVRMQFWPWDAPG